MSSIYSPPTFDSMPTDEELEALLDRFIEAMPMDELLKCGLTSRAKLRNGLKDLWHKIEDGNHLCYTSKFVVARAIEQKVIEMLKRRGKYFPHCDTNFGREPKEANSYCIYLVTGKSDADRCPICNRVWIESRVERQRHIDQHHKEKGVQTWLREQFEMIGDDEGVKNCDKILNWADGGSEEEPSMKKAKIEGEK